MSPINSYPHVLLRLFCVLAGILYLQICVICKAASGKLKRGFILLKRRINFSKRGIKNKGGHRPPLFSV